MPPQTILLVDDDLLILQLGRELLEYLGFRVAIAGDAPQALELFQRLGRVDLVILDYHLPGLNGQGLLRELRSRDAGVQVLIASGYITPQEMAPLQETGVCGVINKPFRIRELQQRIQEVLAGAGEG